ncbi:uncharacterized protein LOC125537096 [Triticum urartu]|uniref:uncharacterized protein LOC125537096 n=1 Tax=Triticum urartu TaxID=4572 RepID=UPI002044B93A|nr:uncharacterized protein LOC125537096 [Triticum urartu]
MIAKAIREENSYQGKKTCRLTTSAAAPPSIAPLAQALWLCPMDWSFRSILTDLARKLMQRRMKIYRNHWNQRADGPSLPGGDDGDPDEVQSALAAAEGVGEHDPNQHRPAVPLASVTALVVLCQSHLVLRTQHRARRWMSELQNGQSMFDYMQNQGLY